MRYLGIVTTVGIHDEDFAVTLVLGHAVIRYRVGNLLFVGGYGHTADASHRPECLGCHTLSFNLDVRPLDERCCVLLLSGIFSQMYASWIVIGSRTGEMESIVSQREINTDTASYLTALRAALRQINGIIYTSAAENMIAMDSSILQLYKDGRIDKHTAISEAVNPEIMSKRLNLL